MVTPLDLLRGKVLLRTLLACYKDKSRKLNCPFNIFGEFVGESKSEA